MVFKAIDLVVSFLRFQGSTETIMGIEPAHGGAPAIAPSSSDMNLRDRLTCTVREACRGTGIGKTKMHELINGGAVESLKVGRRRLVKVLSLLRL